MPGTHPRPICRIQQHRHRSRRHHHRHHRNTPRVQAILPPDQDIQRRRLGHPRHPGHLRRRPGHCPPRHDRQRPRQGRLDRDAGPNLPLRAVLLRHGDSVPGRHLARQAKHLALLPAPLYRRCEAGRATGDGGLQRPVRPDLCHGRHFPVHPRRLLLGAVL